MRISRSALAGSAAAIAMLCGQPAIADEPAGPLWGPHVDFEGRWGGDRNLGEADLFLPLWQDGRSLLFGDIRARLDDQGSREGNVGIGYRRMLDNGWNIGGYGFFDLRRTDDDNLFRQATLGVEALSFDWDFRANAYLPLGDRSKSLPPITNDPYAELHSGTIQVVTPGVTLREERAMAGFDVEVGRRVPIFAPDDGTQLRAYAGFYHFSADGAEDVTGPRLRLELTIDEIPALWPGARLTLGAELQHDEVRETEGFLLARLRVPLYDVAERPLPARPQVRRMTDPIVRDIDIVAQPVVTGQTPEQREFAVDPRTGLPYATVETIDAATVSELDMRNLVNSMTDSVVILNGDFTVTDSVEMAAGQTLIGGGGTMPVQGETSGIIVSFTAPGQAGTLTGNLSGDSIIDMGQNSTLRNLTIENASGGGVHVIPDGVLIADNTITTNEEGIFFPYSSDGIASGNIITTTGDGAYGIIADSGDNITASGNVITTSGDNANGIEFIQSEYGRASDNIIVTSGTESIGIRFRIASHNGTAGGNIITTSGMDAVGVFFDGSNNGTASGNTLTTSGEDGMGLYFYHSDNGAASGNAITTSGNMADGVNFRSSASAKVTGNTIVAEGDGIALAISNDGTISDNTIFTRGTNRAGIRLLSSFSATIEGNRIEASGTTADGLVSGLSNGVTVKNNVFGPITGDALYVFAPSTFDADSTGNTVTGTVGGATCDATVGGITTGTVSFTGGTVCAFP